MKKVDTAAAAPRKPRGRPRSFDRDAALDAAMSVFWDKGFEAASIADLTEAMGINPPSLYAAFGDKEALFLESAERYQQTRSESCPYADEETARGSVERLLTYMAQDLSSSSHPRGCLLVMAAATAASSSPKLQKALAERRASARQHLKERIEEGIERGDVPRGTDAAGLADFYATVIAGMSLQARDGASRRALLATVERAMSVFPPVAKASKRREAQAA